MTSQPCKHPALMKRVKIPQHQYVCRPKEGGCGKKLILVIPQWGLMTPEEFERWKAEVTAKMEAVKRQRETGLVTPDEARAMKQQTEQKK